MYTTAENSAIASLVLNVLRAISTRSTICRASSSVNPSMIHTSLPSSCMHSSCTFSSLSYFFITSSTSGTASLLTNLSPTSGRASLISVLVIWSSRLCVASSWPETSRSRTWIGSSCTTYDTTSELMKWLKAMGRSSSSWKHSIACLISRSRYAYPWISSDASSITPLLMMFSPRAASEFAIRRKIFSRLFSISQLRMHVLYRSKNLVRMPWFTMSAM